MNFKPHAPEDKLETTWATVCTDGSTIKGKGQSGAAFVMVTDSIKTEEWNPMGSYWKIEMTNNNSAELSALNKALRSVPVTVNLRIYTDSQSSIEAIAAARGYKSNYASLRCQGRPYLRAIIEAIQERENAGSITDIRHVRSHTGLRTIPSIGNEAEVPNWQYWTRTYRARTST